MLPATPSFERVALNRTTFGARDTDEAYVNQIGWAAWVGEQLNPPNGDDPDLAQHLAGQTMHIEYEAEQTPEGSWPAVNEDRPLISLTATADDLWNISRQVGESLSFDEISRLQEEVAATTWIRATHSRYQLREVMTDFWHNHFSIGDDDDEAQRASLPSYDRDVIRAHVFGNFREMLEAVATSPAMLLFLDNAFSVADHPNENYARELIELHTLGADQYRGKTPDVVTNTLESGGFEATELSEVPGFTDQDVIEASRALSGWTLEMGQWTANDEDLPDTGRFVFHLVQHNYNAGNFLGESLAPLAGSVEQGQRVLDIVAAHPGTATFVCTKICRRLFGDPVPSAVVDRAVAAWTEHQDAPDQIKRVMEAILLGGNEIGTLPPQKVRRPFERLIAFLRTTDTVVNANTWFNYMLSSINDGIYRWPTPDGRPEDNEYWLTTGSTLTTWNLMIALVYMETNQVDLYQQTPVSAQGSVLQTVEYWVGRLLGYEPGGNAMNGLLDNAMENELVFSMTTGEQDWIEHNFRQLVTLIATTEEFSYR